MNCIKEIFILIFVLIIFLCILLALIPRGDASLDFIVDERDIELIERHINGEINFDGILYFISDYNEDGRVNRKDIKEMKRIID